MTKDRQAEGPVRLVDLNELARSRGLDVKAALAEEVARDPKRAEAKARQMKLIDRAARGSIEAAADLAEGYLRGTFGEPASPEKARKWAAYAAKRGNEKAQRVLEALRA